MTGEQIDQTQIRIGDAGAPRCDDATNDPRPLLGNCRIDSIIGKGGMSVVYKAQHLMLDQTCAVKMLHPHLAKDEQAIKRFRQEAHSAAKLRHAGIVAVHDFGITEQGQPYLIMDYVSGRSLAEIVSGGPLEPARALRLVTRICEALAHAHAAGVIHRDIKPSNVIVVNEGKEDECIKLVDFGIAKIVDNSSDGLTQTGESLGSPPYMSPEQCCGRALDARSDVYSTGCLLFELITGQPPFRGGSVFETIHMQLTDNPPSVSKMRPTIPNAAHLDNLILQALAKSPDDRFQSASEFGLAAARLAENVNTASGIMPAFKAKVNVTAKRLSNRPRMFWLQTAVGIILPLVIVGLALTRMPLSNQQNTTQATDGISKFRAAYRSGCELLETRRYAEAEKKLNEALAFQSTIGEQDEELRDCLRKLATAYRSDNKIAQAEEVETRLQQIEKYFPSLGSIAANTERISELQLDHADRAKQLELSQLEINQARLYLSHIRYEKAEKWAKDALKFTEETLGPTSPNVAKALGVLTAELAVTGHLDEAEKYCHRQIAVAQQYADTDPSLLADAYYRLGHVQLLRCMKQEGSKEPLAKLAQAASQSLGQAIKLYEKTAGDSPQLGEAIANFADAESFVGKWDEAEALLHRAVEMHRKTCGPQSMYMGQDNFKLAGLFERRAQACSDPGQAHEYLSKALASMVEAEKVFDVNGTSGRGDLCLTLAHLRHAQIALKLGDEKEAESEYRLAFYDGLTLDPQSGPTTEAFKELLKLYSDRPAEYRKINEAMAAAVSETSIRPASGARGDLDKPIQNTDD